MKNKQIEQGVSLYGFEQRFVEEQDYGIEEMFAELNKLGVSKFELVGSQVFSQYPRPKQEEIANVIDLAKKYNVTPFAYGGYIDRGRITGRAYTDEDVIYYVTADLMTARELGCVCLRETNMPPHLLPRVAKLAEEFNVAVGIEVHSPARPGDKSIQNLLAIMDEINSPFLGLIPDFGCFIERPVAFLIERHIANGADPKLIEYVIENRHNGFSEHEMIDKIRKMGGGEAERGAIAEFFGMMTFGPADIDGFATLIHRTLYFHSKFYHVTVDLTDPQIPLERLLNEIVKAKFSGVLMSEYEGHMFHLNDAHEQLERHLQLENKILNSLNYNL
ncbi:hypothetical protein ACEODM_27865 [Klebsiella oxytoca]|uniref:hypothetical protein n=1 Tax=Klebsiella oxytoca TaxID=571 RepID=UPI003571041E